jgi:hypothetical protein
MLIKFIEIVENSTKTQLSSSVDKTGRFTLKEVSINPKYVVCVREEERMAQMLEEGYLPQGLDQRQRFTRVFLDRGHTGIDVVVVGDPETVEADLKRAKGNKELLNG